MVEKSFSRAAFSVLVKGTVIWASTRNTSNIASVKRIFLRRSGIVQILRSRSHMGVSFHTRAEAGKNGGQAQSLRFIPLVPQCPYRIERISRLDNGEPFDSQPTNALRATLRVRQAARNVSRPYTISCIGGRDKSRPYTTSCIGGRDKSRPYTFCLCGGGTFFPVSSLRLFVFSYTLVGMISMEPPDASILARALAENLCARTVSAWSSSPSPRIFTRPLLSVKLIKPCSASSAGVTCAPASKLAR